MKIRAHNCELKEVDNSTEAEFLNENHYQGYVPSSWCRGLYYNNELVCIMSFGKPRYNKRYDWELLRLCTKKEYQVYGGASKLFKYFCENNSGSIISYCNESKFTGKVYESIGLTKLGSCKSYHYEKDGKSYHRSHFQKWILVKQGYETTKTEKDIMKERGYTRIDEIQATWVYGVKWYIYKITFDNGVEYIGQHLDRGDEYNGSGTILKRMIDKGHMFTKEILVDNIYSQNEADKYEKCAIRLSKLTGNNINIQEGGRRGYYVSHTSPSMWQKGHEPWNKGTKGEYSLSEETKQKISAAHKGKSHPHKGVARNEETRAKISNNKKRSYWKCIELDEIRNSSEWRKLGYSHIERNGYSKGYHFVKLEVNNDTRN